jgi:NADH-quinone oxidoreductase subunit B
VAAVDLPAPYAGHVLSQGVAGLPAGPVAVDSGRGYSLWLADAGLACCAVEYAAALRRVGDRQTSEKGPQPSHANVLIVAGTVTDKVAPLVLRAYQQVPEPKFVISFGACSNSGGPYWDSYCVTKGVDQMIPVDVYVPGCPPRPEALIQGLDLLSERRAARQASENTGNGRDS